MQNTGSAVVEALGTPGRMLTLAALMEKLPYGTVKHVDAFHSILDRVGVHQIQPHTDAPLVSLVYQVFQIIRLAKPGAGSEEVSNLVAKASVIRVLHNGHKLNGIVACFLDVFQRNVCKLPIGTDAAFFLRHTHMGLIDKKLVFADKSIIRPGKQNLIVDNLCIKGVVGFILNGPSGIQGKMLGANVLVLDDGLYLAAVPQSVISGEEDFPVLIVESGERMRCGIPCIKFAFQVELVGGRSPLTVIPAAIYMVETVIPVTVGKFFQGLSFRQETGFCCLVKGHSCFNITC